MKAKLLGFTFLTFVIVGFSFLDTGDVYYQISKNLDMFGKIYKEITFNYVDEINSTEFIKAGIRGMLEKLDPYTVFVDESEKSDIEILTNGKYGGIGVTIGVQNNQVKITEIMDGYPAARQGLKVGDIILEVDGFKVSVENYDDVSPRVKGEPGTQLELKILRNNGRDTLTFNLVREEILLKSLVYFGFYPPNSNNVYLKLNSFNKSAGAEIQSALKKLRSQKEIKSLILDLRGNPGGLLESAIEISDKFLPKNLLIVSTRGKDISTERKYYSTEEPILKDEKIIILTNENTASASEIVAGAIQDHDRGIILGTRSFGKGLVQTITPITNDVSLKLTTAKYYTPSGRCIQKVDYSKENKVVVGVGEDTAKNFLTDNKRKVYSGGGILPDSVVENSLKNNFIDELISQGVIIDFVDDFVNKNNSDDFVKQSEREIFNNFKDFITKKSEKIKIEPLRKLQDLITQLEKDSLEKSYINELNNFRNKLENYTSVLVEKNKNNITALIMIELVRRYYGSQRSIEESLKYDNQVATALRIISDEATYSKLLNKFN
jgi:carboxyl-terminal processing protease